MARFGLKLWSSNEYYITPAVELYNKGVYDYIELYAEPETFDKYINIWKKLDIPYIIHAPHFVHGVNLSDSGYEKSNKKLLSEAFRYADELKAEKIIIHPGIKGDYKETAKQLKSYDTGRILVENKPKNVAVHIEGRLNKSDICVGYSPEQIDYIINETGCGFCMDIGHAICACNSDNKNYIEFLESFNSLNPYMYHISDGDIKGTIDKHYNIGTGTFDFKEIFKIINKHPVMSIETEKHSKENLNDFAEDVEKLRGMCSC